MKMIIRSSNGDLREQEVTGNMDFTPTQGEHVYFTGVQSYTFNLINDNTGMNVYFITNEGERINITFDNMANLIQQNNPMDPFSIDTIFGVSTNAEGDKQIETALNNPEFESGEIVEALKAALSLDGSTVAAGAVIDDFQALLDNMAATAAGAGPSDTAFLGAEDRDQEASPDGADDADAKPENPEDTPPTNTPPPNTPLYTNVTANLSGLDVHEDQDNTTFTLTLSETPFTAMTMVVNINGTPTTYTIPAGTTSFDFDVATKDSDVYVDPDTVTATIVSLTGGGFDTITLDNSSVTITVADTIDTTTVDLSAAPSFDEDGTTLTYTVTLGSEVRAGDEPVTVTFKDLLGNEQTITVTSGTTGTTTVAVAESVFEDVYKEADADLAAATDVVVTGGSDFEKLGTPTVGTVELVDTIDTTTVDLSAAPSFDEDGTTLTYTVTLGSEVRAGDEPVTVTFKDLLGNEQTITVTSGTTGTTTVAVAESVFEDVYKEADADLAAATDVVVTGGSDFEKLGTPTVGTVELVDTIDTTTVDLSAAPSFDEDGTTLTYTVTLGSEVRAGDEPVTVTFKDLLGNEQTITVTSGTTGTTTVAVAESVFEDVYKEADADLAAATDVVVTGGSDFEKLGTPTVGTVELVDTIDTTTVDLSAAPSFDEDGTTLTYTVTLGSEVRAGDEPVTVTFKDLLGNEQTITVTSGTTGTTTVAVAESVFEDVYKEADADLAAATDVVVTGGSDFEKLGTPTVGTVELVDTIDTTTVDLSAAPSFDEDGTTLTYTVTLGSEVRAGDEPVTVTFKDLLGNEQTITVTSGTTGTTTVAVAESVFEDVYKEADADLAAATDVVVTGGSDFEKLGTPTVGTVELVDTIDTTTVDLSAAPSFDEDGTTLTYTVTLGSEVRAGDEPVTVTFKDLLGNEQTITVTSGTTGTTTVAVAESVFEDVYKEADADLAAATDVVVTGGSDFEKLGTPTVGTVELVDTIDTTTVDLSAAPSFDEDGTTLTYTVTLGSEVRAGDEPVTVTFKDLLGNEQTITVTSGTTGTTTVAVAESVFEDVYKEADADLAAATDVVVTGGSDFEKLGTPTVGTVELVDTIDTTTVDLSAAPSFDEDGTTLTYTVTLGSEVRAGDEPVTVTFKDLLGNEQTITVTSGTTGTTTVAVAESVFEDVYKEADADLAAATDVVVTGGSDFEKLGTPTVGTVELVDTIDTTTVDLSAAPSFDEDGTTLTYTVTLGSEVRAGDEPVTVTFKDLLGNEQTITVTSGTTGTTTVAVAESVFEDVYKEADADLAAATDVVVTGGSDFEKLGTPTVGTVELVDTIDTTTVDLSAAPSFDEDGTTLTYTVTLGSEVRAGDEPVTVTFKDLLGNEQTITVTSGTTGTTTVAVAESVFEDVYKEADADLAAATDVVVTGGSDFEKLGTPTVGTVELVDTIDTVMIRVFASDSNGNPLTDTQGNYLTVNETVEGGATHYVALAFEPNTTVFNDSTQLDTQLGKVDFTFTNKTTENNDYTPQTTITSITLGTAIDMSAVDDTTVENSENLELSIGNYQAPTTGLIYESVDLDGVVTTTILDNDIELSATNVAVDEDGLAGANANSEGDTVTDVATSTGTITVTNTSDIAFVAQQTTALTSEGQVITLTTSADGQTVIGTREDNTVVFEAKLATNDKTYSFTLKDVIDHPDTLTTDGDTNEDTVTLPLDIKATNGGGDEVSHTIDIIIADDIVTLTDTNIDGSINNAQFTNIIVNGSFEDVTGQNVSGAGSDGFKEDQNLTGTQWAGMQSMEGWQLMSATSGWMEPHAAGHASIGIAEGSNYMDLGESNLKDNDNKNDSDIDNTHIGQVICADPNGTYDLTFAFKDKADYQANNSASGKAEVIWGGVVVAILDDNVVTDLNGTPIGTTTIGTDGWLQVTISGLQGGTTADENRLEFKEIGTGGDNWGIAIDGISMSASNITTTGDIADFGVSANFGADGLGGYTFGDTTGWTLSSDGLTLTHDATNSTLTFTDTTTGAYELVQKGDLGETVDINIVATDGDGDTDTTAITLKDGSCQLPQDVYVQFTADTVNEGDILGHQVTLVDANGNEIRVPAGHYVEVVVGYTPADTNGATENTDYDSQTTVRIYGGTSGTYIFNDSINDTIYEGDEVYNMTLSSITTGTNDSSATSLLSNVTFHDKTPTGEAVTTTGTILDNDTNSVDAIDDYGKMINAQGEFDVVSFADGKAQSEPDVTALKDGGFVVAWTEVSGDSYKSAIVNDFNNDGDTNDSGETVWQNGLVNHDVFIQRYDSDGEPIGDATRVNTLVTNTNEDGGRSQHDVNVVGLENGNYLVTWTSDDQYVGQDSWDNGSSYIQGQIYDVNGNPVCGEFTVARAEYDPIVALPDGGFIVTWSADARLDNTDHDGTANNPTDGTDNPIYSDTHDGSGFGVIAQRFDALGNEVGDRVIVNQLTTNDQLDSDIVMIDDNTAIMTWQSQNGTNGDFDIYAQTLKLTSNGLEVVSNSDIAIATGAENQTNPEVTALSNGTAIITYQSDTNIMAKTVSTTGVGSEVTIAAGANPVITALAAGVVIVYEENGTIFAKTFDGTNVSDATVVSEDATGQTLPAVTTLEDGGYVISWQDENGISAHRYNNDGTDYHQNEFDMLEDNSLTITADRIMENDNDPEGHTFEVISVQDATHGSVTMDANGNITFTPNEDYNGPATFKYTIQDELGATDTATVYLNVKPVGEPSIFVGTMCDADIQSHDIIVNEGEEAVLAVKISGAEANSTVSLTLADGSALVTEDYEATFSYSFDNINWTTYDSNNPISIPEGASKFAVKMDTVENNVNEDDELFSLSATLSTGESDSGTVTIIDDDTNPPVADAVLTTSNLDTDDAVLNNFAANSSTPDVEDIAFFKKLDIGGGLDGDITNAENDSSDPADLGGSDIETTENNLVFDITSLPTYGDVYIQVGDVYTKLDASNLDEASTLLNTADTVYWSATHEQVPAQTDIKSIGGDYTSSDIQSSWQSDDVTVIARDENNQEASINYVTNDGIGVSGNTGSGPSNQLGYDPTAQKAESIIFDFKNPATDASVAITHLIQGENGGEVGTFEAFLDGKSLGVFTFSNNSSAGADYVLTAESHGSNNSAGSNSGTLNIDNLVFDQLRFSAQEYASQGSSTDSSDYFIGGITYHEVPGVEFEYKVIDESNNSSEEVKVVIDVATDTPVPEADINATPTTTDDSITTPEDTPYILTMGDFGTYSDETEAQKISIESLPTNGVLKLDGIEISANTEISVSDITTGKLSFTPSNDTDNDSSFNFKISDGELWSDTHTTTVEVTAIADIPTVSINVSGEEIVTTTVGEVCSTSQDLGNLIAYLQDKGNVSADQVIQLAQDQNGNPAQDQYNLELTSFGDSDLALYDNISNQNATRDINNIDLNNSTAFDSSSATVVSDTINNTYHMTSNRVIFEGNIVQNGNILGTDDNDVIIAKGRINGGSNINAGDGDDIIAIIGDIGANQPAIAGGDGTDILYLSKPASSYYFSDIHFHDNLDGHIVDRETGETLTFNNIEGIAFGDGSGLNCDVNGGVTTTTEYKYDINISAALADTDNSETLTVSITGVPIGAVLSSDIYTLVDNNDGSWDVTVPAGVKTISDTLTMTTSEQHSDLNLNITARATETNENENGLNYKEATASDALVDIEVTDSTPNIDGDNIVYEEALTNSYDDREMTTGTFKITTEDGLSNISINGTTITESELLDIVATPKVITTTYGEIEINGYDATTGMVNYSYEIKENTTDHTVANQKDSIVDSISIKVTDTDGDTKENTLDVRIVDDIPTVSDQNAHLTFGADGTVTATTTTNLVFTLDVSGSMTNSDGQITLPGGIQTDRLELAKDAIIDAVEAYMEQGAVNVNLTLFAETAKMVDFSNATGQQSWMTVTANNFDSFKSIVNNVSNSGIGQYTNYEAAIDETVDSYNIGTPDADKTVAYFLSDGNPTAEFTSANNTNTYKSTRDNNGYDNSDSGDTDGLKSWLDSTYINQWTNFITNNNIEIQALGIGTGIDTSAGSYLAQLAVGNNASVVEVTDPTKLSDTILGNITGTLSGNIFFGADAEGTIDSIKIDDIEYTKPTDSDETTITTTNGGSLTVNFTDGFIYF